MPQVEVERPQRERDERVGEDAQAVEEADAQDGRQQRAGEAEHEQQRPEVADEQVLDHVHPEQLVGQRPRRVSVTTISARPPKKHACRHAGTARARAGERVGARTA